MNNNEPIVLGNVKKGKTGKPLVVLIVFVFIGAFLLFMPSIINYFGDYNVIELIANGQLVDFIQNHEAYMNKTNQPVNVVTTTKKVDVNEPVLINKKTVITYNNIIFNNFILQVDSISFDVKVNNKINFDELNYYLVLTKGNKDYIYKLSNVINKSGKISIKFKDKLSDTIEVKGIIKEIKSVDYPSITLNTDESGLGTIICNYESNKIEYTFKNNALITIKDTLNYVDNNDDTYIKVFTKYTNISNELNNLGATSTIIENSQGFILDTLIDLNSYQFEKNTNGNYYSLNTKAKIIHFEMNAKGFDCK